MRAWNGMSCVGITLLCLASTSCSQSVGNNMDSAVMRDVGIAREASVDVPIAPDVPSTCAMAWQFSNPRNFLPDGVGQYRVEALKTVNDEVWAFVRRLGNATDVWYIVKLNSDAQTVGFTQLPVGATVGENSAGFTFESALGLGNIFAGNSVARLGMLGDIVDVSRFPARATSPNWDTFSDLDFVPSLGQSTFLASSSTRPGTVLLGSMPPTFMSATERTLTQLSGSPRSAHRSILTSHDFVLHTVTSANGMNEIGVSRHAPDGTMQGIGYRWRRTMNTVGRVRAAETAAGIVMVWEETDPVPLPGPRYYVQAATTDLRAFERDPIEIQIPNRFPDFDVAPVRQYLLAVGGMPTPNATDHTVPYVLILDDKGEPIISTTPLKLVPTPMTTARVENVHVASSPEGAIIGWNYANVETSGAWFVSLRCLP